MKNLLDGKAPGFYLTLVAIVLGVITGLMYFVSYHGFECNGHGAFSATAFVLTVLGVLGNITLVLLKKNRMAPILSAVLNGIAFLFFIHGIYFYISVMAVGIDTSWNITFFLVTGLFLISFGLNIANVFFPQEKSTQN